MAAACSAYQEVASCLFHLGQQVKKMISAISADSRSQLVAPDVQGLKRRKLYIPEDFKHILLSRLPCDRTDIPWLGTIIRASELGMTHVDIPLRATYGVREKKVNFRGQRNPSKFFCAQTNQEPSTGKEVPGSGRIRKSTPCRLSGPCLPYGDWDAGDCKVRVLFGKYGGYLFPFFCPGLPVF